MNNFLTFLVYSMRTIDGQKGSADLILNYLNEKSKNDYIKNHK